MKTEFLIFKILYEAVRIFGGFFRFRFDQFYFI